MPARPLPENMAKPFLALLSGSFYIIFCLHGLITFGGDAGKDDFATGRPENSQSLPDNTFADALSDLSHPASIRDIKDSRSCIVFRRSITSIKFLPTCFSLTLFTWVWIN